MAVALLIVDTPIFGVINFWFVWLEFSYSPSLVVSVLLVGVYLALLITGAELLNRFSHQPGEITRKIVHIGSGQVLLFAWWLNIPGWVAVGAGFVAACIALLSYYLPILPSLESVGRRSFGTFFYALSISLLAGYFFPRHSPEFAALGIMVMAWGDGLAALVGQNFGKHPYTFAGMKKSWEGSLAMLAVSFVLTLLILVPVLGWSYPLVVIAILVAITATLLETVSSFGVDNITVPLGSAWLAYGLSQLFLA